MPFILLITLLLLTSCGGGGHNHRSYIISDIGQEEELYVDDED
jgi:hypothetical protein